jgi:hypothetical protein
MKYLKNFNIIKESSMEESRISIDEFVRAIGLPQMKSQQVIDWWQQNRGNFNIHYFRFNCPQPIMGCFLGSDTVAINEGPPLPAEIKLFILLHESAHCDQHREGRFEEGYFTTVVENRQSDFLEAYSRLEIEANTYAQNSLMEMGFDHFVQREIRRLRMNEQAGHIVYRMMRNDIEKFRPQNFTELLLKQIL